LFSFLKDSLPASLFDKAKTHITIDCVSEDSRSQPSFWRQRWAVLVYVQEFVHNQNIGLTEQPLRLLLIRKTAFVLRTE